MLQLCWLSMGRSLLLELKSCSFCSGEIEGITWRSLIFVAIRPLILPVLHIPWEVALITRRLTLSEMKGVWLEDLAHQFSLIKIMECFCAFRLNQSKGARTLMKFMLCLKSWMSIMKSLPGKNYWRGSTNSKSSLIKTYRQKNGIT